MNRTFSIVHFSITTAKLLSKYLYCIASATCSVAILSLLAKSAMVRATSNMRRRFWQKRLLHGLQQKELAILLRVDPHTMSSWEADTSSPPEASLRKLEQMMRAAGKVPGIEVSTLWLHNEEFDTRIVNCAIDDKGHSDINYLVD